jgi:small-conductance mechanosensitive channel
MGTWSDRHPCRSCAAALLGLLILASAGRAQDAAPEAGSRPHAAPATISAADVAVQVERVTGVLDDLLDQAEPHPDVAAVGEKLGSEGDAIRRELAESRAVLAKFPTLDQLQNLQRSWKERAERLRGWNDTLTRRAKALEQHLALVDDLRDRWEGIAANLTDTPPPLAVRVREVVARAAATRRRLETRRDEVLVVQNLVAQQAAEIDSVLKEIGRTRERMLGRLFVRDAPPFWRALTAEPGGPSLRERVRTSLAHDLAALDGILQERADAIPAAIALFGVMLVAAFALRARARHWGADEESVRATTAIFERPISVAVVLWVFLTPLPYSGAPPVARQVLALPLAIALFRLLPLLLARDLHSPFYALMGFVLVDRFRDLATALPTLERALFAAECATGLAVLWLLGRRRAHDLARQTTVAAQAIAAALRLAAAMLAIALVANGLGYRRLATLLGDGTIRSTYTAVVAYALARVAGGIVVVALRTRLVRSLRVVQRRRLAVQNGTRRIVRLAVFTIWIGSVLRFFDVLDTITGAVSAALAAELAVGEFALSLGDVAAFVFTVWASYLLSRVLRTVLEEDVFSRLPVRRGLPYAISTIASYTVLVLGFLVALAAAGAPFGRITILVGGLGVGIGFGLQNVVNNFVSGIILLFERPIQIGDTVQMGELMGNVKRIGLRSSTIHTWEGAEVIVPNANLVAEQLVNWTLSDRRRRIDLPVGVAYDTDPERVLSILVEVAGRHPDVLKEPETTAVFLGFGDSALNFQLRAWTDQFESFVRIRSDLGIGIHRALADAGIAIPFPQRDLHVKSVAPEILLVRPAPTGPAGDRSGSDPGRPGARPARDAGHDDAP